MATPARQSAITWRSRLRQYVASDGRAVSQRSLKEATTRLIDDTQKRLRAISQQYADGRISLVDWQIAMKDAIRSAHTLSAGLAMGGKNNMTVSDWGRVGQKLRIQYERLNRFALQLEQGGKINLGRVDLYARSVRSTYENARRLLMSPLELVRWARTKTESCPDCIAEEAKGPQFETLFPQIGTLQCHHNCGCVIVAASE